MSSGTGRTRPGTALPSQPAEGKNGAADGDPGMECVVATISAEASSEASSSAMRCRPTKPVAPVTRIRARSSPPLARLMAERPFPAREVGIHHPGDKLAERHLWLPAQLRAGFRRVAHEQVYLRRTVERRLLHDIGLPVQ